MPPQRTMSPTQGSSGIASRTGAKAFNDLCYQLRQIRLRWAVSQSLRQLALLVGRQGHRVRLVFEVYRLGGAAHWNGRPNKAVLRHQARDAPEIKDWASGVVHTGGVKRLSFFYEATGIPHLGTDVNRRAPRSYRPARYEIFPVSLRFLPYSGPHRDEKLPPMSAKHGPGLASRSSAPHLMTTYLPLSLTRILSIACCLLGAVAAILMAPPVVAQQPAFLTNGLVAYYPFNGNANDESGNGNNGVLRGGAISTDRFGKLKSSLEVKNAKGEYVEIPSSDSLNITGNQTISAWINLADLPQFRTAYTIVSKRISTAPSTFPYSFCINFQYGFPNDYNTLMFGSGDGGYYLLQTSPVPLSTSQWMHFVVTVNSGKILFYINNRIVGESQLPDNFRVKNNAPILIGSAGRNDLPAEFFNGQIDDVRIYNRALSDMEVKVLYDYECTPPDDSIIKKGLVAKYPFDGDASSEDRTWGNGISTEYSNGTGRSGKVNSAARFNGKQPQRIEISSFGSLRTISAWIKSDPFDFKTQDTQLDNAQEKYIFSMEFGEGIKHGLAAIKNATNSTGSAQLLTILHGNQGLTTNLWDSSKIKDDAATWYHIVYAFDDLYYKLYLNGILLGTAVHSQNCCYSGPTGSQSDLIVGDIPNGGRVWLGEIDDLRMYNRTLSDFEVNALYILESVPSIPISITSHPTNITTDLAKDVSFSVTATNALTYQWFKDGNALPSATNAILSLTNARPTLIGDYFAVVSNAYGTATSSVASLNIKGVESGIWKGLVAYYPFNGNAIDLSPFSNNATLLPDCTFSDGVSGRAIRINGRNGYASAPYSTILDGRSNIWVPRYFQWVSSTVG